jgi:hypothetical protein
MMEIDNPSATVEVVSEVEEQPRFDQNAMFFDDFDLSPTSGLGALCVVACMGTLLT